MPATTPKVATRVLNLAPVVRAEPVAEQERSEEAEPRFVSEPPQAQEVPFGYTTATRQQQDDDIEGVNGC